MDAFAVRMVRLEGAYEQIDKRLGSLDGRMASLEHGERADRSRRAKARCHLPLGDWHRPGQLDHPHARYISAPVTSRPHVDYSRRPQGVDRHSQRTPGACLWRVAASMRPSEMLTPDETVQVDQALKKIEAGDFVEWSDLKRAL